MTRRPFGVLMLHGFPDNAMDFEPLEPELKSCGLPFRIPNLRGMGLGSPDELKGVTWQDWKADAQTALADLLTYVDQSVVMGYSMGGALALRLAAERPERIDSLVLVAPMIQLRSSFASNRPLAFLLQAAKAVVKRWPFPPSRVDGYRRSYKWAPVDAVFSNVELMAEVRARLPQIRMPVLVIQGRMDNILSKDNAAIVYNGIATPLEMKQILWFEGVNHDVFFDKHHEEVLAVLMEFIRSRIETKMDELPGTRNSSILRTNDD